MPGPSDPMDWDAAYDNFGHVPDAASFEPRWRRLAAAFRSTRPYARLDLAYGAHPRAAMDVFPPEGQPNGVAVFVHGGYWMKFDKSAWSHLADGLCRRGWTVAIPSYPLAPDATITAMTQHIAAATTAAAALHDGPVLLAGHSAGGHLVSRMVCRDTPLAPDLVDRIAHVLSISGLHDLRPLRQTKMNETLKLSEAEAAAESAVLSEPIADVAVTAWVGGDERPEFLRQSDILAAAWSPTLSRCRVHVDPDKHHFDVIDALADSNSDMVDTLLTGIA